MKKLFCFICFFSISVSFFSQYLIKNFDDGSLTSGGWQTFWSGANPNIGQWEILFGNIAKASNYSNSNNYACVSWLVSPSIDLSSSTSPFLIFDNVTRYTGPQLELYISSNYDGFSNPDVQGTWFNITSYVPNWDIDDFSWTFVSSGNTDLTNFISSSVTIAFKYIGTNSDGATWEIDNIVVTDSTPPPPPVQCWDYYSDTLTTNVSDILFQSISPQTHFISLDTFPSNNPNCDSVVEIWREYVYNPTYYSDTITYFDTTYISISVTDTLYIDITVTGVPSVDNTISVYPNPANDVVMIDNGNYSTMSNYNLMIFNSLLQQVFSSQINTQQFQIPVSTLGAEGTYFIQIFDGNNNLVTTKYLVLN